MAKSTPFLTLSKAGIWYYQRWVPKRLKSSSNLFKISLRTRCKDRAKRLSRVITVKFDKLVLEHFSSSEEFSVAMKLLYEVVLKNLSIEEFEELDLSNGDDILLGKGRVFSSRITEKVEDLKKEITLLKSLLENKDATSSGNTFHEELKKIQDAINPPIPEENNPTLTDYFSEWCEEKSEGMTLASYESSILPAVNLFNRFIMDYSGRKDLRVNDLKADFIRKYQRFYSNIPKGYETKNKTIPDLTGNLVGKKKSPKTISDNYSAISSYLKWGVQKGYSINGNLFQILTSSIGSREDKKKQKIPVPLVDSELADFFNSSDYSNGSFKTSAMYWVPLIALVTGARMGEIVQLERHNIQRSNNGIWYFDITDEDVHLSVDPEKKIKTAGSKRQVPIHDILLKLRFLEYVETRQDRLFPDEKRNKLGKFDRFQKAQARYRKKIKILPSHDMEKKDFHSFRHTVRTRLSEIRTIGKGSARFDESLIDAIVGHTSAGRSIGEKVYNHSQYLEAKSKALSRLKYDSIDFNRIIPWEKCLFHREVMRKRVQE